MKIEKLALPLFFFLAAPLEAGEATSSDEKQAPEAESLVLRRGRDAGGWTYLAYVKPLSYSVGYGDLRRFVLDGPELHVAGRPFETGLIAHAASSIQYRMDGRCTAFRACYGMPYGSVARFVVLCDGKEVFRSSRVWATGGTRRHGINKPIQLDITGAKILELRTYGDDNGSVSGSHSAWGNPRVR